MTLNNRLTLKLLIFDILFLFLYSSIAFSGEFNRTREQRPDSEFSLSASYLYRFDTPLGDRNEFSFYRLHINSNWKKRIRESFNITSGLSYDFSEYSLSESLKHHLGDLWSEVQSLNVSLGMLIDLAGNWKLFVAPSAGLAGETGAEIDESFTYGGLLWTSYRLLPSLTFGLGAGVFRKLDSISAFPVFIFDWKISDNLRISNPSQLSPAGSAGLEISYSIRAITLAAGGGYESNRFRLNDHGKLAGGVVEDRAFPLWVRLSAKASRSFALGLYGGLMKNGELTVEDRKGKEVYKEGYNGSVFLKTTMNFRF